MLLKEKDGDPKSLFLPPQGSDVTEKHSDFQHATIQNDVPPMHCHLRRGLKEITQKLMFSL